MSRVGKKPIPIPPGVKVDIRPDAVDVRGPKGTLTQPLPPGVRFEMAGETSLDVLWAILPFGADCVAGQRAEGSMISLWYAVPGGAPQVRVLRGATRSCAVP